ncbi:MAG: pseudouridylate synthase [Reichenbachiella sp.]
MLEILFQDEYLIAINKPPGLIVHRSAIAADAKEFALQMLRDQVGKIVHPVHRLDRKTSGVLLFAFDKGTLKSVASDFAEGRMIKKYLAIVRGYCIDEDTIDYALVSESGKSQEAITDYRTLAKVELEVPFGKHSTSRYSLVEATPKTGRMHQLRKHFAHIFHPIIGDRPHGCNKQNKLFKEKWRMKEMMLHAHSLKFIHPIFKKEVVIKAALHSEFKRMNALMGFSVI